MPRLCGRRRTHAAPPLPPRVVERRGFLTPAASRACAAVRRDAEARQEQGVGGAGVDAGEISARERAPRLVARFAAGSGAVSASVGAAAAGELLRADSGCPRREATGTREVGGGSWALLVVVEEIRLAVMMAWAPCPVALCLPLLLPCVLALCSGARRPACGLPAINAATAVDRFVPFLLHFL